MHYQTMNICAELRMYRHRHPLPYSSFLFLTFVPCLFVLTPPSPLLVLSPPYFLFISSGLRTYPIIPLVSPSTDPHPRRTNPPESNSRDGGNKENNDSSTTRG